MEPRDFIRFCSFVALMLLMLNTTTSLKKKKTLWKTLKHVENSNRLTSAADRGNIHSNVADGVDESKENTIKREKTPARVVKQEKITKPIETQTFVSLKKKERRKSKKELRRRKLRKLRHELRALGIIRRRHRKECKSWSDCAPNECCLWFGKKRHCKKRPKRGQRCKPSLLPGVGSECPCQTGLTCKLSLKKRKKNKRPRYKCHRIKYKNAENYLR